ncbi:EAL domain-containing protein [Aquabacter sp. L1I39]|uniref:putative bifunctional diguanylate cyclase/phosphodiesterase n=1 Tax=Aquabacter sp. L1I39 TaxID=2820278 RepID=UPI001ADC1EB1|nr:EAL domain-containing protein [Aquabacter sp. L1I39]QTL05596.1 EAL domain-containing protein [Aquabacter sp. L1I39]
MRIVSCLADEHNVWLLLLSFLVCIGGSAIAIGLFRRARHRTGRQRLGWIFIAAVSAGCVVWCTHFVAMLAYRNDVPAVYDPFNTVLSLFIVIAATAIAFLVTPERLSRGGLAAWLLAGLTLGAGVASMHYVGMMAYEVNGLLLWNARYVAASVGLSILFALAALGLEISGRHVLALAAFVLCIVSLHFTGMAGLALVPYGDAGAGQTGTGQLALVLTFGVLLVGATGAVSAMIDSDVSAKSVEALRRLALVDSLTGLPNRNSFTEILERELGRARLRSASLAVVVLDFDRLKGVNEAHGQQGGDALLREAARRMQGALGTGEFLARLGSDEFAATKVFFEKKQVEDFVRRLQRGIEAPVRVKGFNVMPQASFGVALFPGDGESPAQLLANADLALLRAKGRPGRGVSYYEPAMDEAVRARRHLVHELRRALRNGEFELHYQVQVALQAPPPAGVPAPVGKPGPRVEVMGYEALLRWRHPLRGHISPGEFIPVAEESGLIIGIGEWVLRTACRDAAAWTVPANVAVNVSALQILHGDLPGLVARVLNETGLAPERLELEVTETMLIGDRTKCLDVLQAIRALGVAVAMDDFGTGYSSLDTLRAFPFHRIKLDRHFMRDIADSREALAILRAVLTLGRALDMRVLVEGVETAEQVDLLRAEGCEEAQGFLFGRPAPLVAGTPPEPDAAACRSIRAA